MVTSNLRDIYLFERNWPGNPNPNLGIPTGGFDSKTGGHDVSVAVYPVGTKIQIYTDGTYTQGYSTMTYLRCYCVSGQLDIEDISSLYGMVGHCDATIDTVGNATPDTYTSVINVGGGSDCTQNTLVAFACGSITSQDSSTTDTGQYGWFWTGGVCPYIDITFFDKQSAGAGTDMTTDDAVAIGDPIYAQIDTSLIVFSGTDLSINAIGVALKADA